MKLDRDEISFLANLSGGNPYLIQVIGFYYHEDRKHKKVDYDKFENKILEYVKKTFEGYWKHLNEEEREFLFEIETATNDQIGYALERKGFIIWNGKKWEISSKLFGKFILTKMKKKEKEEKEFEDPKEKQKRKLLPWIFALIGFAGLAIGIRLIVTAAGKLQELDIYSISKIVLDLDFLMGLFSLIFSILSFIISLISMKKSGKGIYHE